MIGIFSTSTNAPFNLATEQYLLHNFTEDIFFLYVNEPSIIVGKHQNTLAEINYHYINEKNIPVYRRLSGGGTVYHDLGNLNFCFIKSGQRGHLVDFEGTAKPIQEALQSLGVNAEFGKRHDLLIDGKKISGNASHVYKNRVLHHGTLLFNADLTVLNDCLKTNPNTFKDRAVKSVRSEVTNIQNTLKEPISFKDFSHFIFTKITTNGNQYVLTRNDEEIIKNFVDEKYSTWEWNYGYSPTYELQKRLTLPQAKFSSKLKIEKGIIKEVKIKSSNPSFENLNSQLSSSLVGLQHEKCTIKETIDAISSEENETALKAKLVELFI